MLTKYYVESGPNFLVVVLATDEMDAIFKAFTLKAKERPLKLADVVMVNQRGFVWHRPEHQLHGDELVLSTFFVLGV